MTSTSRLPAFYLSHGGGPCFWMDFPPPFGRDAFTPLKNYLAGLLATVPQKPRAILLVSAHWEEKVPTVGAAAQPSMIYDYYGFPPHTYELKYPAPGAPDVAARAQSLLLANKIAANADKTRGYDHGVFVPMLMIDPAAEIPVATLSLAHDLDPARHLAMGRALRPLRDEGVLIIGSGNSYHNLRRFFNGQPDEAEPFDHWLRQTVTDADAERRQAGLMAWEKAPHARDCHPREEHLLPLMVVAGAGGADTARCDLTFRAGNKPQSCFRFG